ncbi:MAG TPA: lipase maturation factor family protein [Bryobacterales bacterium]|nr:lipase maturation factor family protein [Bryobacterales bacterium]
MQRGLALVYLIAFLIAANQFIPLLGERGLEPVPFFIHSAPFAEAPSLFFLFPKDAAFRVAAWLGVLLSCAALAGLSERCGTWLSALVWGALWALYLSFVNVGQIFYAFGWESILLEAGFLAIFAGSRRAPPQRMWIWLNRWVLFRVMFGAGLIKLRGDPCWRNLTCLQYHYETQPMPNPLSWYFHWAPAWTHTGGVLFNHFVEVVVPFGYFLPQPVSTAAGLLTIVFQILLMLSGNLSFLNLLTLVLALSMLDGRLLAKAMRISRPPMRPEGRAHRIVTVGLAMVVGILSIEPVLNLISPRQLMNYNYNPLHLVNTYGAFGGVTRTRYEVVVEGTADAAPGPGSEWRAYEFKGKPGDLARRPPQIAPYHLRLDWLMWFAAMGPYSEQPWFACLVGKLLAGDAETLGLLGSNPFSATPPRFVRALLYEYHFTAPAERQATGRWWKRTPAGPYFPPVSLGNPAFRELLEQQGCPAGNLNTAP